MENTSKYLFFDKLMIKDTVTTALFTIFFGIHVVHVAATRPLVIDECFTLYIATMPTIRELLDLLWQGPDAQPPLFHLVTRFFISIFGESELTLRLPAMLGFWVFCISLYLLVRIAGGGLVAASVAMIFPCATGYFYYAHEARPYGLLLGCVGFGLLNWIAIENSYYKKKAFFGLLLALSMAVCFHYFSVLYITLLCITEVILLITTRRLKFSNLHFCKVTSFISPLILLHLVMFYSKKIPHWKTHIHISELLEVYYYPFINSKFYILASFVVLIAIIYYKKESIYNIKNLFLFSKSTQNYQYTKVLLLSISLVIFPLVFFSAVFLFGQTFFRPAYVTIYILGISLVFSIILWDIKLIKTSHYILLLVTLIFIARHPSDFMYPWKIGRSGFFERLEKSQIAGYIKDSPLVFVTDFSYLPASYQEQHSNIKHLYLLCAYTQYNQNLEKLRDMIPQIQRNPRCPKFFLPEELLRLNSAHYILVTRNPLGIDILDCIINEFPLLKEKYTIHYQSDEFILYRRIE